jgi:hypothetical protein
MARFNTGGQIGVYALDAVSTTARHKLGTIVRGRDTVSDTDGEYIYVKANVAFTEGQIVILDLYNEAALGDTDVAAHVADGASVGFALGTVAADEFCFIQIAGLAKVKAGTVAAGAGVQLTSTAGTVDDAAVAGAQIAGAVFATADGTPAAGFAYANINRPMLQTQYGS